MKPLKISRYEVLLDDDIVDRYQDLVDSAIMAMFLDDDYDVEIEEFFIDKGKYKNPIYNNFIDLSLIGMGEQFRMTFYKFDTEFLFLYVNANYRQMYTDLKSKEEIIKGFEYLKKFFNLYIGENSDERRDAVADLDRG